MTLELTSEEAHLVRDAMIDMKHHLKASPSERGQRLCKLAEAIADTIREKQPK